MVRGFCTAAVLPSGTDFYVDHLEDPVSFSEGVYDLLCDSIDVRDAASVSSAGNESNCTQDSGCIVRGLKFLVSGGACAVPRKRIQGRDAQEAACIDKKVREKDQPAS